MKDSFTTLIVDDSVAMRKMIRKALRHLDLENVIEAGDGKEALHVLAVREIGLIISDWNMPKVNGLELLKMTQKISGYNEIPFIMLTSEAGDGSFKEAMKHGATDYITKPFTNENLANKVRSVIEWFG